jgi:hypothetical protein
MKFSAARCFIASALASGITLLSAHARAGGGHSYSGGGGGHSFSSGGGSSFHFSGGSGGGGGSMSMPQLVAILLLVIIIYYVKKKMGDAGKRRDFNNTLDPDLQSSLREGPPEGSEAARGLREKLGPVFIGIQTAWDKGSMDPMRAIISDGVYNRFQMQLEMNRLQGIRNRAIAPQLLEARVVGEDRFGRYLSIDFMVHGRVKDSDVRISDGNTVRGGDVSDFKEVWSFTRLADAEVKEALRTLTNCPKCAAPLSDAGGSRCGHCGSVLNSGAYDWVLAEITQCEEWLPHDRRRLQTYYGLLQASIGDAESWLSPQELEDRASVVFVRYQSALHQKKLALLNTFASPELVKFLEGPGRERPLHQLSVGAVDLQGFSVSNEMVSAYVRVKYSGSETPHDEGTFREKIMVFRKSAAAKAGQGNLSSSTCPSCGGPIESTDQAKCAYCDNVLSSPETNWVFADYGGGQLLAPLAGARAAASSPPIPERPGPGTQVRLLSAIVSAALEDGVITVSEEGTVRDFARHFGLGPIIIDAILLRARADAASMDQPVGAEEAARWLNNFIMVAAMDGRITADEEAILLSFARRHKIEEKKVRFALKAAAPKQ